MDINALRVFNSLYKLGITEEEFKEIEEEQKHIERTGLYISTIKKGKIIGVSHDEKHKIVIKEVKGKIEPKPKSRVLFKTMITSNILSPEIYTLNQIAQYRALDTDIKYTADNMEELKDRICDRFNYGEPQALGDIYDDIYTEYDDRKKNKELKAEIIKKQLMAIFWLFDEDFTNFNPIETRKNIARIVKVFSHKNRRLAIIQINERWEKERGGMHSPKWTELIERVVFKIKTFTPRDEKYNYVCPNREIFLGNDYSENTDIWLDDNLFEKVTAEELKILSKRLGNGWLLLTADEFNNQKSAIRVELMSARRKGQEEQAKDKLIKSIKKQFGNGKLVRQGIIFTKESVSYNGITLKGSHIGEYISKQNIILQEYPDFNDIFNGYVEYILNLNVIYQLYSNESKIKCNYKGKNTIYIKNIKIVIEQINNNIFVNNHRICKEDLDKVIKNAINYDNQNKYDDWLMYVSRVNLKLQKVLENGGVEFELKIDRTEDNSLMKEKNESILLSIPIKRENNKNIVIINNKEYRVKDIKALFDLGKNIDSCRIGYSGGGYLQRTIKLLYRAIDDITSKEIGELINNGKAEYKKIVSRINREKEERLKRSKEFLENAVRITISKKVDNGYFVIGLSGTTYYVGDDLRVWTIKDGKQDKYLCIIDSNRDYDYGEDGEEAKNNDFIAKRLLALSKDKVVAKEIYYNGDKMEKYWLEIQDNKAEDLMVKI